MLRVCKVVQAWTVVPQRNCSSCSHSTRQQHRQAKAHGCTVFAHDMLTAVSIALRDSILMTHARAIRQASAAAFVTQHV
jgi:hypothetical protein